MPTLADEWEIGMDGGVPLVPAPGAESSSDVIADQLLDGGIHFDNLEYRGCYNRQRRYDYLSAQLGHLYHARGYMTWCVGLTRPIIQITR